MKPLYSKLSSELQIRYPIIFDPIFFAINMKLEERILAGYFLKKNRLKVEFLLLYLLTNERIAKKLPLIIKHDHISFLQKKKDDIDDQLLHWLNESYECTT